MVVDASGERVQARTLRRKPSASRSPVRHNRNVDIEGREWRAKHPAAIANV